MNKGIKEYSKLIETSVGNSGTAFINVNDNDANMHIVIPLYISNGPTPVNLSLIYTQSDYQKDSIFGKGIQYNYHKKIMFFQDDTMPEGEGDNWFEVTNSDGLVDIYHSSNNYMNIETMCYLIIEKEEEYKLILCDIYGNRSIFECIDEQENLFNLVCIEPKNGLSINFNYDNSKSQLVSISCKDTERMMFTYNNNKVEMITIRRKISITEYALVGTIGFTYDGNGYLKSIEFKNNIGKTLNTNYYTFDFCYDDDLNTIQIKDSNLYLFKFYLSADNLRVISFRRGYNNIYYDGYETHIYYSPGRSVITDSRGFKTTVFFNDNDLVAYEINDDAEVISYKYDENNKLIARSNLQRNHPSYANEYSLIRNGYFEEGLDDWEKVSQDIRSQLSLACDPTSNDYSSILGSTAICIKSFSSLCSTAAMQVIYHQGNYGDIFTFSVWGKKHLGNPKAVASVCFYSAGSVFQRNAIEFTNINNWQYMSEEIRVEEKYDKIVISLEVEGEDVEFLFDAVQLYLKPLGIFYTYDAQGNLIESIWGDEKSKLQYNSNNLLSNSTDNFNYIYDEKGNLLHYSSSQGVSYYYEYDEHNRNIKSIISNSNNYFESNIELDEDIYINDPWIEEPYPIFYRDKYINPPWSEEEYIYDKALRKLRSSRNSEGVTTAYYYNDLGDVNKVALSKENINLSINYEYNENKALDKVILENGTFYEFGYESLKGRLSFVNIVRDGFTYNLQSYNYIDSKTLGDTIIKTIGEEGDSYYFCYNKLGMLQAIKHKGKRKTTEETLFSYSYDNLGRLVGYFDLQSLAGTSYLYDIYDRVTLSSTYIKDEYNQISYQYDDLGNLAIKSLKCFAGRDIVQSYATYSKKGATTFFEHFKDNTTASIPIYTCFFNRKQLNEASEIVLSQAATAYIKNNNGSIEEGEIKPSTGQFEVISDGQLFYIKCNPSYDNLSYPFAPGAIGLKGTVMFWFRKEQGSDEQCLLEIRLTSHWIKLNIKSNN
ncbi:MAG: hypothetical protein WDA21_04710, partial [Bacilli bacterium]